MGTYSYVAIDKTGKTKKGTLAADSPEKAAEMLKSNSLVVASVTETGALGKDVQLSFMDKKPAPRDMAVFCRQFVSIVDAGVSAVKAFEMLSEQTENKKLRSAISDCKLSIEKGESLAISMGDHRDVFSDIFVTMVEAGEASGSLDVSFTRMAEQFEKQAKLSATVKKATIYPIVIGVVAVIVVVFMLAFVIPTFEDMFKDLGTDLPAITLMVVAASDFILARWYVLVAIVAALVIGVKTFAATPAGRHFFGKLAMKLPLFGNLTVKTASAQMARTLSTLVASGISLIDALEITSGVIGNIWFREAVLAAKDEVAVGNSLSEPLQRCGLFPPLVHHMVGIGEETGNIEGMLTKLADYYEDEVEQATQQLMAAMEPLIIVLMAAIIGTIVIAVLSPMASMYTALDTL